MLTWMSRHCSTDTQKVAVFPVPDWDLKTIERSKSDSVCVCVCGEGGGVTRLAPYCAMTSRPLMICLMALCWIAEGFSKPAAQEENGCCITAKHISNSTLQNCHISGFHILYRMSYFW